MKTDVPVTEGFVALLESFLDTIVIQTVTALVVVSTMIAIPELTDSGLQGMQMSSAAFARLLLGQAVLIWEGQGGAGRLDSGRES